MVHHTIIVNINAKEVSIIFLIYFNNRINGDTVY